MTATTADQIAPEALTTLRNQTQGDVVGPDDPGYDLARRAWNLNAAHSPAVVVQAESAADVGHAVRFARAVGLGVGVLATGHGTGAACAGGVLITTARMRAVVIDPAARTATVAAGAMWDDVIRRAAPYGLVGLPGSSTTVGVVGYTLGGGFGWLGRRYGLAAHSVRRAEVVTADGELIMVSRSEHADLFWGIQGGTGNFGIVTSLEFALHPVEQVYGGNLYYPLERARDVLEFYADWSRSAPMELTAATAFPRFPPLPRVPEQLRGRAWACLRGCFCGNPTEGAALINQARAALGPPSVDTFGVMAATDLAAISMDPVDPLAFRNHFELLGDLGPATIDALLELAGPGSGSPLLMFEVRQLGGALRGPAGALSPMAHTEAGYSLNAIGITPTPDAAAAVRAHLAKIESRLRPHATGETYLNFLDLDGASPSRVRAAYSSADWARLLHLKATYDPTNVFRFNRNISAHVPNGE